MAVVVRERPVNAGADAREGPGAGRIAAIRGKDASLSAGSRLDSHEIRGLCLLYPDYQYVVLIGNAETREAVMSKNTSIALGDHFQKFVQELVSQGRFGSTSEVVRAGLRLLEEQDIRRPRCERPSRKESTAGRPSLLTLMPMSAPGKAS